MCMYHLPVMNVLRCRERVLTKELVNVWKGETFRKTKIKNMNHYQTCKRNTGMNSSGQNEKTGEKIRIFCFGNFVIMSSMSVVTKLFTVLFHVWEIWRAFFFLVVTFYLIYQIEVYRAVHNVHLYIVVYKTTASLSSSVPSIGNLCSLSVSFPGFKILLIFSKEWILPHWYTPCLSHFQFSVLVYTDFIVDWLWI